MGPSDDSYLVLGRQAHPVRKLSAPAKSAPFVHLFWTRHYRGQAKVVISLIDRSRR